LSTTARAQLCVAPQTVNDEATGGPRKDIKLLGRLPAPARASTRSPTSGAISRPRRKPLPRFWASSAPGRVRNRSLPT
jgi:hypothetical protein